ncbi:MAG: hypothetical protein ABSG06_11460 [Methanoregula sp.]|jgi:hypothetical protein
MAAHRKYADRYITSVTMERAEKELCEVLGIEHNEAHRMGLHVYIEQRITEADPRVMPEIIEKFAELKKTLYRDFQAYIRLQDSAQKTLVNLAESKKAEELIEVYDRGEEAYIRIPKSQFDPEWHRMRGKA